jgi:hypothetical protein
VQYNNAVRGHGRHSGQLMRTFLCKRQHIPVQCIQVNSTTIMNSFYGLIYFFDGLWIYLLSGDVMQYSPFMLIDSTVRCATSYAYSIHTFCCFLIKWSTQNLILSM